jgi:polyisoprenyl-teichoic acid--peptidoglycan teichoic acid transferase
LTDEKTPSGEHSTAASTKRAVAPSTPVRGEVRRRRWRKAGYTVGAIACFFALAIGGVFGHFYWGSSAFRDLFNNHGREMASDFVTGKGLLNSWTPEKQFPNRSTINVLVLGIDHDLNNKRQIVKSWGRSDAILLARVDFYNKKISALTIPRDSAVRIPGYPGEVHKINAAHSYKGPQLTVDTIKSVLGVQADAVVSVNFEGFQKLVDAIGGVEINVDKELDYDDNWGNLHVHLKPGLQHMNGYVAMGYVRIRKQDSDFHRSQRQHQFLDSVRSKIKTPQTFLALPRAIDQLSENVNIYNLSRDQMYTLMNFARTLNREDIHVETLPSIEGRSYVTIDTDKSKEVIQRLFFPNQVVALNIEAPNMSGRSRSSSSRRSRRARRTEYSRPTGGLSVERPAAGAEGGQSQGAPEPPSTDESSTESSTSRDGTSSNPVDTTTLRATG